MRNILIALFLVFTFATIGIAKEIFKEGPFSGIDLSTLPKHDAQTIRESNEDFILVLAGHNPRYAKFDKDAPLPRDGGTTYYKGKGYTLTILKSLSSFGKLQGYIYGPIIKFDEKFAPGNWNTIESLRFYTSEQLNTLIKKR